LGHLAIELGEFAQFPKISRATADVVILAVGGQSTCSVTTSPKERAKTRTNIDLPTQQVELVNAVSSVLRTRRAEEPSDLSAALGLPGGPWLELAKRAIMLPIFGSTHESVYGLLLTSVSSRRVLDAPYRSFLQLVTEHVGTAIADATAYEAERMRAEALNNLLDFSHIEAGRVMAVV
jgi:GAF domain-containing protein